MALTCPITLDRERLKAEVLATYANVAEDPRGDFHFHRGPAYAARVCEFFDSFRGTNKEDIARKFQVRGADFVAYE